MRTTVAASAVIATGAAVLAAIDLYGRHLIATHIPGSPQPSAMAAAELFVVIGAIFAAGLATRPDAIRIALPVGALLVVGDLISVRLHAVGATNAQPGGIAAALAFFLGLVVLRHPARLARLGPQIGWTGVALCALPLLPGIGITDGGQRLRVGLAGQEVMPGELGRPMIMIGLAAALAATVWAEGSDLRLQDCRAELVRALRLPIAGIVVTFAASDLGPAAVLALATAMTVAVYTGRIRWAVGALAATAWAFAAGTLVSARLAGRLHDVVDPLALADDRGQAALAHFAIAWGGWTGTGLGAGVVDPRLPGAVPLGGTDLALAVWGMETGVAGLLVVLALFTVLVWGMFTISLRAPAGFPRMAGCALASLTTAATCWVVGAALGVFPFSGIVTPFVSGGRSAAMALAFALALFCRLPDEQAHHEQHPDGVDRTVRALRAAATFTLVAVGLTVVIRTADARVETIRHADNPILAIHQLDRGRILASDGTVWAESRGTRSMDTTMRWSDVDRPEITGETALGTRGNGIEGAWAATLRCGGSGQAPVSSPNGAVSGDPSSCEPADIQLTLDPALQLAANHALQPNDVGAIVAMDPRDGALLALAGREAFIHRGYGEPDGGLTMGARTAVAPGSTFKLATAAAGLEGGVAWEQPLRTLWRAPGDGLAIRNAGGGLCGGDLTAAMAMSCNTAFAAWATAAGPRRLEKAARRLGIGGASTLSGVPIAQSSLGRLKPASGLLAVSGIGQGRITATPLDMARAAATVAARGRRPTAKVVDAVCHVGRVVAEPKAPSTPAIRPEIADQLRSAMRAVAAYGTASRLRLAGTWAVKTGTSELPALRATMTPAGTAGWIVGFPTEGPAAGKLAIAAVSLPSPERPRRSGPTDGVRLLEAVGRAATLAAARRGRHPGCQARR